MTAWLGTHRWFVALLLSLLPSCSGDEDSGSPGDDVVLAAVGEPCAAAAECQAGLICPYESGGGDQRSCVDPLQGIYDDGSGPELEQVGSWARKRIGGWEEASLVCNDGSPYAYFFSPGEGDGANKWLLFLKGGDSCGDDESCARRWPEMPQYMRQVRTVWPSWSPGSNTGTDAGIFARDQSSNHFRQWSYVYLHYCSSDHFSGTAGADDNELRLHFRGRALTEAVVDELLQGLDLSSYGYDRYSLADAEEVLVAGGSAGSVGTRHNMDMVATKVHAVNPSARVRGFSDSVWTPPAFTWSYSTESERAELWDQVFDADCMDAHPETYQGLCGDAYHLLHGGGIGAWLGEEDEGHLGVAREGESAVDGLFIFQAQYDNTTFSSMGLFGVCARTGECESDADCQSGQGCSSGICFDIQPCSPMYCTPDDEPCHGLGGPPTCLGEVASHENDCTEDSDCQTGEECLYGFCAQQGFTGCEDSEACPEGFSCSGRRCSAGIGQGECQVMSGYEWDEDTQMCLQLIGCGEVNECAAGYACVPGASNPVGQVLSWGIREELHGLAPKVGVYAPASTTHTATLGYKYYGQNLSRIDGHTFAQVVDAWMSDSPDYYEHIDLANEVSTLLWVDQVTDLSASSLDARAGDTSCEDDAFAFYLCDVDAACEAAEDVIYAVGIGNSGTTSQAGNAPASAVQLQLGIAANPSCGEPTLELESDSWLDLTYRVPTSGENHRLRLALPQGQFSAAALPTTLYIGADGATYLDRDLTVLAAGRLD